MVCKVHRWSLHAKCKDAFQTKFIPVHSSTVLLVTLQTCCSSAQVPCSLEYWDELQQAFVPYREFSLSESSACQLHLPSLSLTDQQKELVASDLWRIVLNNNGDVGDEQR